MPAEKKRRGPGRPRKDDPDKKELIDQQSDEIHHIASEKIKSGSNKPKKIKLNYRSVSQAVLCAVLKKSQATIRNWEYAGMPRREDDSYDTADIIDWMIDREVQRARQVETPKENLDRLLKEKDVELKDLQLQRKRGEVIQRDQHLMILGSRANALKQFLVDSGIVNLHFFVGKNLDELKTVWIEFVRQAMDRWTSGSSAAESEIDNEQ